MKLRPWKDPEKKEEGFSFWCPACRGTHRFSVPDWKFDGNMEQPTIKPSVRVYQPKFTDSDTGVFFPERTVCHLQLTDGVIKYYGDSPHELAGKKVPLPEMPEDYSADQSSKNDAI